MGVVGKIALLVGQADEAYQQEFISGVMKQAFKRGYSVCVFSMYIKYQNSKEREVGDSNIFSLINYDMFDAVIILSDTIQTPGVEQKIEETIHNSYSGPVICVDVDSPYFESYWTDGYSAVYSLVSHLIEKRHLTDIAYLTGRAQHPHSKRRLEAFMDAMNDHALKVDENRVGYGDFWYTSGMVFAEEILRDRENMPQAVVCANDCMAIGLADELSRHGINIPEDMAIAGYGTSEEGWSCPKSLTSTYIPAEYYGSFTVECLERLMAGENIRPPFYTPELFLGESTGDRTVAPPYEKRRREKWVSKTAEEGYYSIHNTLTRDLQHSNDLSEFASNLYEHLYQIQGIKRFCLCLNDLWLMPEYMIEKDFPEEGYSDKIAIVVDYYTDDSGETIIDVNRTFKRTDLLPDFSDEPEGYIFTPIYAEEKSLGYVMISYGKNPRSYDELYRLWTEDLAEGLESLRRLICMRAFRSKVAELESIKYAGSIAFEETREERDVSEEEMKEIHEVERILDENLFVYHFQPIVNTIDGGIFSYEALMRSATDWKIPPLQIIKHADTLGRISDIEKATFNNILSIVGNYMNVFNDRKVFINSIPGCELEEGDRNRIQELLSEYSGIAVVELTEQDEIRDDQLADLKQNYKDLGIELALDDYGTGYSNMKNLLRYMPGIVKIDRSILTEIQGSKQKQHFVKDVIDFCHSNSILALAEGVETSDELKTVIRLGADLVQGYYTGRPSETIVDSIDEKIRAEIRHYHEMISQGDLDQEYEAGRINRISVNNLVKEGVNSVIIGTEGMTFRDITLVGTPGHRTNLHVHINKGYEGTLTLENVSLIDTKGHPCIDIEPGSRATIRLVGMNHLTSGGIRVPEDASLFFEGEGNLNIYLDVNDCYGIGNGIDSRHGDLFFYQDGTIFIESMGRRAIAIGSGLGGRINICKGMYNISLNSDEGVAVGSINGSEAILIHECSLKINASLKSGVCVGSIRNSTQIGIWNSFVQTMTSGKRIVAFGTLEGERAEIKMHDMGLNMDIISNDMVALGSLSGSTVFDMKTSNITCSVAGENAYVFGGTEDVDVRLKNTDVSIVLKTENGAVSKAPKESIKVYSSRYRVVDANQQ
ncbi:MAG: EAL domain-containing protein [Eubacterium sp.]|nr:EAL domain-containing protein [Eubacterium sp.]